MKKLFLFLLTISANFLFSIPDKKEYRKQEMQTIKSIPSCPSGQCCCGEFCEFGCSKDCC